MSDDASNEILIKIGELRGEIRGHEKRLDQQHADILRLSSELADHKATFLKCFAEADERNQRAQDRTVAQLGDLFAVKVQLAVTQAADEFKAHFHDQKSLPIRDFIQERPYAAVGGAGVIVALLNWVAVQVGIHVPAP